MKDDELPPDPEETYDLDDEPPYDLDDETPTDLAAALAPEPVEEIEEIPIDLDDGVPLIRTIVPAHDHRSLSDEKERVRALDEVLRDQARREVLRDIAYRRSGPSLRRRVVSAVLVVAALAVWFLPVPGVRASIPFPLEPEEEQAGLELATWVQAQQVEAFRQRRGRLPDVLREAGEPMPGMTYVRIDAQTYRLSGATERMAIVWTSGDTLDTALRETVARLQGAQP
jgi:hypothetical protein